MHHQYDVQHQAMVDYVSKLPNHNTMFPPPAAPVTLTQVIFGNFPEMSKIDRSFMNINLMGFIIFMFQITKIFSFYQIGYHNGFKFNLIFQLILLR